MVRKGMYVTRNSDMIIAKKNGINGLITSTILVLATLTPTNKIEPTGGVQSPIHKFKTKIIPKWTGSIPIEVTTGKKIGVKIKTAGVMSIKIPTNNKIILITSNMIILLSLSPIKRELISWGIFSNDITQDMHIEAPIKSKTIAVVSIDCKNTFGNFSKESSLYKNPKIIEYITAIAEASVAVNIPVIIPPITIINKNKLGIASINEYIISIKLDFSPTL